MKIILACITAFALVATTQAQINVGQKIKDKVAERADTKVDQAIDEALDKTEEEAKSGTKTKAKTKSENSTGKTKIKTNQEHQESTTNEGVKSHAEPSKASLASYSKFDFVPGEKVIFFDDFSQDNVGDLPGKWNTNGKGEVVTTNRYPGKWFKLRNSTTYVPETNSNKLPENYTIEYDMIAPAAEGQQGSFSMEITSLPNKTTVPAASDPSDNPGFWLVNEVQADGSVRYLVRTSATASPNTDPITDLNDATLKGKQNEKFHVSIAVNKQRFRYYVNEVKVLDLPKVMPAVGYNAIVFRMWGWDDDLPVDALISNFRYAEGVTDVRSKLLTEGKLVTRGILFDVNADKIKPESYGTIKEIAQVLKDNAGVRVKIVGHTDSDGSAASNLDLSKRRAMAVKNIMSSEFGIDASRMETEGKGSTVEVSPNTTPEGKANNRRVEFIKL